MVRRIARLVGVVALVLSGTGVLASGAAMGGPAAQMAHATKTYSSTSYHYSFKYPANWMLFHQKGVDILTGSSDRHALMLAVVQKGAASQATIKSQLKDLLSIPGAIQGKPGYAVHPINGVPFQGWQAVTKSKGTRTQVIAFGTAHGKFTYYFLAGVDLDLPSTQSQSNQLGAVVDSIAFQ